MKPKNLCLVATVMALSMVTGLLTSSGTAHAVLPLVPHYDCYNIIPLGPPYVPAHLTLETQFGTEEVTSAPNYIDLCLPAQKWVPVPPPGHWEGDPNVPHVACVPIAGRLALKVVKLTTQFGVQKNVVVGSPIEACMPANKAIYPGEPLPPVPAAPHYECFQITGPSPSELPSSVLVKDQFLTASAGTTVELGGPTRLCLAAIKNGHGNLNVPDVECFAITSGPAVDKFVNLLTQFPPVPTATEFHVGGPPRELCVPVLKTVVTGVGGIQNLPDIAESAAAAESSGGSSSLPYAAIAGVAAGLVVLGAGGWYARRRWLS